MIVSILLNVILITTSAYLFYISRENADAAVQWENASKQWRSRYEKLGQKLTAENRRLETENDQLRLKYERAQRVLDGIAAAERRDAI